MNYERILFLLNQSFDSPSFQYHTTDEIDTRERGEECSDDDSIFMHQRGQDVYDLLIKNAKIVTMDHDNTVFERAHIAIKNGLIAHISTDNTHIPAQHVIDADEKMLTPGLIDCHTHIIYAGNLADDFLLHLEGISDEDIASLGGGLMGTVKATRRASLEELTRAAADRAKQMMSYGATTLEVKSGYGLDLNTEIKILTVAKLLENQLNLTIIPTFLGAYAIPLEYENDSEGYIDYLISTVLPVISTKKLASFVDAHCDINFFSLAQIERLFNAAVHYGFKLKIHAEQFSDQKAALLAARFRATSVDHLEYLAAEDCQVLAEHKTVAVLLPASHYSLNAHQRPPIEALRHHDVPIAIASDANPESPLFLSLPMIMNMACVLFGLTLDEAWKGVTLNAAKALKIDQDYGSVEVGKRADLIIWSTQNQHDIVYNPTVNFCKTVIKSGQVLSQ